MERGRSSKPEVAKSSASGSSGAMFLVLIASLFTSIVCFYVYSSRDGAGSTTVNSNRELGALFTMSASNRNNNNSNKRKKRKNNNPFDEALKEQQIALDGAATSTPRSDSNAEETHASLTRLYKAFNRDSGDLVDSINMSRARDWKHHFRDSSKEELPISLPRWGSYSPGIYFGLKTRSAPTSLSTGILWRGHAQDKYRHKTSENELSNFYWRRHNGFDYGEEVMIDDAGNINITASFLIKNEGNGNSGDENKEIVPSWSQYFQITDHLKSSGNIKQLIFYMGVECSKNLDFLYETITATTDSGDKVISGISHLKSIPSGNKGRFYFTGNNIISTHFLLTVTVTGSEDDDFDLSFSGLSDIDSRNGVVSLMDNRKNVNSNNEQQRIFSSTNGLNNEMEDKSNFLAVNVKSSGDYKILIQFYENTANRHFDNSLSVEKAEAEWVKLISRINHNQYNIEAILQRKENEFDIQFKNCFTIGPSTGSSSAALHSDSVSRSGYEFTETDLETAKRAVSALLGGVGFFHGVPDIADGYDHLDDGRVTAPERGALATTHDAISLLSATPSRTAFPRGFLWDEGFHQLVLMHWSPELTMDVLSSWLDAMYQYSPGDGKGGLEMGWLPREMILGDEPRLRVPTEFITQRVNIANPPTLLLVIEALLKKARGLQIASPLRDSISAFARSALPKAVRWVNWFLVTQKGSQIGTFRWRGRGVPSENKLSPNTLASGLDDFPRSQVPSSHEQHVDLLCWVARACKIVADMHAFVGSDEVNEFDDIYKGLLKTIDSTHWSDEHNSYLDIGIHAASTTVVTEVYIRCKKPDASPASGNQEKPFADITLPLEFCARDANGNINYSQVCPPAFPHFQTVHRDHEGRPRFRERVVQNPAEQPAVGHIPRRGYVGIFPLILELLPLDSRRFGAVLDFIESPVHLWTEHGLRSMSTTDTFYQRSNAPGDNPYWRGPIWININYLALRSLYSYKSSAYTGAGEGDAASLFEANRQRCDAVYGRLRANVLRTVLSSYASTGFFWEQYNDVTGAGMRGHPFSGWTTLVLGIMAEAY